MTNEAPICICGAPMVMRATSKFTHKNGAPKKFWGCSRYPECKETIGAHPDGKPLGFVVDRETRQLRHEVHQLLEKFWNYDDRKQRREMYAFLKRVAPPGHMGQMDKDQLIKLKAQLVGKGVK